MTELRDYAIFKNPFHCEECGWLRLKPLMPRELAIIASALNRAQSPQHGWKARKIKREPSR